VISNLKIAKEISRMPMEQPLLPKLVKKPTNPDLRVQTKPSAVKSNEKSPQPKSQEKSQSDLNSALLNLMEEEETKHQFKTEE
jgi:hypothetical protein